jgi:hypothetical protein
MDLLTDERKSVEDYLKGLVERERVEKLRKEAVEARERMEKVNKELQETEEALKSSPLKTPRVCFFSRCLL